MKKEIEIALAGNIPKKEEVGKVRWYLLDTSGLPDPEDQPEWEKLLSPRRWEKLHRLSSLQDKKNSAGAGLLLGYVFHEEKVPFCPKNIVYGKHGKPYHEGLQFSLSHSGNYVVCAVSDVGIGCDIQKIRPYKEGMIRRFFSREEQEYILGADEEQREERFTILWSRKESYCKMTGEGLTRDLRQISLPFAEGFIQRKVEDYRICICLDEHVALR
ncbi:MAG: 4'-phosphopantetheinyl transferase superfamily protein [Eubacteriales bacterium]|nr:4'-phosphopantetheinyl transferase superfamily protein [Eubacteriales bacterium]